jgi:hypothetical protein
MNQSINRSINGYRNLFVKQFMKFLVPNLATQPTTPPSSLIVIGPGGHERRRPLWEPYGTLTGHSRDRWGLV